MSQTIAGGASNPANWDGTVELNGTFLVRPAWGWTRSDPIGGLSFQSERADASATTDPGGWPRLEIVLDGSNLLPFHYLRSGDRIGRSVVKIQREDGATGTGFLVASDVLLTNNHVLPTRAIAASALALANYEVAPASDAAGRAAVSPLDPALMFVTNADLDVTFCGVRGLDFLGAIPLDRDRMQIAIDETVTIVQHPRGRPKEVALRESRVIHADAVVVQYSCDTEPGSSGSPVFNNQWRPVAIHHASVLTDSPEGRRIAVGSSSRYLNEGIRLSAIALWLDTAEASTPEDRKQVGRLRGLFGGLNPRAGFFGALGRRAHGRSAPAFVADTYRGRAEVFDLGVWDTRALASMPGGLRDRLADIGHVVADMGLDLWCLSAADPAWLGALCGHLWAAHGLCFVAIPIPTQAADSEGLVSGVIVRQCGTFDADALPVGPGRTPYRLRVRARLKCEGDAEFLIVPFPPDPAEAARAAFDGWVAGGPDWVFVGDAGLLDAVKSLGFAEGTSASVLAATAPQDGAIAIVHSDVSPVVQFILSPNLRPYLDLRGQLTIAVDRDLPASLKPLRGPSPIALRLSFDPADASPVPVATPPPIPIELPPDSASLDAIIERKLRDLIGPLVAKLVAEAREMSDRGARGDSPGRDL